MQLSWYYKRLKSMGLREICWRIHKIGWQLWARLTYKQRAKRYKGILGESARLLKSFEQIHFYGIEQLDRRQIHETWKYQAMEVADRYLRREYNMFAIPAIDLSKGIDFNKEYKQNLELPLEFAPWMDYRNTKVYGDFKYFWELPRLQHLVLLSKAYFLSQDRRYANEVKQQLELFMDQSPFLLGVNWIMPMEAGIRLVSIVWIIAFLKGYLDKEILLLQRLEGLIQSHVYYITQNYAQHSSANNHLVGEAAGVFVAATCFPFLRGIKKYQKEAYFILCREAHRQHHSDGVNKEQGMHYQMFCFDFLVLAGLLGQANQMPFPKSYWDTIHKSATFMASVAHQDGTFRHLGDSDDGHAVILSKETSELKSLLAIAAVLFEDHALSREADQLSEKAFWLLGSSSLERFEKIRKGEKGTMHPLPDAFPDGGYYVIRSDRGKVVFDCGPLGFGALAAHGHADSLGFTLDVDGRSFLIDTGTYTYVASDSYRNYFRSTLAHNTVTVDNLDQSEITGPFLWGKKAESILLNFQNETDQGMITAEHHGYKRLPDPVLHRRKLVFDKTHEVIVVNDFIECAGEHQVKISFHFAPQYEAEEKEDGFLLKSLVRRVLLQTDKRLKWELYNGSQADFLGWASQSYDQKMPIFSIVGTVSIQKSMSFSSSFRILDGPMV